MLEIVHYQPGASSAEDSALTLSFDQRSRARVELDDGREAGLFLPRGAVLRDGDLLITRDGLRIGVRAADKHVSTARADDPLSLARACYHLGTGMSRYRSATAGFAINTTPCSTAWFARWVLN